MNTGLPGSNYDDSDWRSLALLLDQTGVFIWQTDESQRVVFSSRGLQDLVKPTVTDIEGKLFRDLGWITEHNLDDALFTPTSADDARTMSVDFAGADGAICSYLLNAVQLTGTDGQITGWRGTCKRADAQEELTRWKDLADAGGEWIWELDADLKVSWLSENQEHFTGIPNAHFMGQRRAEFKGADFAPEALRQHQQDLAARRPFRDYTYPITSPAGQTRWLRISGVPHFDSRAKFIGYRGTGRDITEQQEALLRSRYNEQLLLDALELTPIALSIWDADERFVISNLALRTQTPEFGHLLARPGVKMEDYTRAIAEAGIVSEAVGREEEWISGRMAQHRNATGVAFENQRVNGNWIRVSVYKTKSGGRLATSTDITELKRREQELRQAQTQLTDALEAMDQGFAVYDPQDRVVLVNPAFRKMFPIDEKYLTPGTPFEEIVRAGAIINKQPDVEAFVKWRMQLRGGEAEDNVVELSPGVWKIVNESRSYDGGIVSVWTDITELKQQEQILRETEGRFSTAFHNSPLVMMILRLSDMSYLEVNTRFEELLGYPRLDVLNDDGLEVSILDDKEVEREIQSRLKRGQEVDEMEVVLRRKNGELFEALISADLIEIDGEQRVLLIAMDFSSHKRLERSLVEAKNEAELANRTKSEFLANMSHELRTPLNAVIGFSDFLSNEIYGPLGDGRYAEYVGDIRDSGTHLLNLINEILDVARVEAGRLELREAEVDVAEIIERCLRSVDMSASKSGLTLTGDALDDLPFLFCDETRFRQILMNVLSNAVKFTEPGGSISVYANQLETGNLEIRIRDTGIGIAEEDMVDVFKVFGQADTSIHRRFEGAGLGLPLTKALVELHSGEFELESTPGVGTTAIIRFPEIRLVRRG